MQNLEQIRAAAAASAAEHTTKADVNKLPAMILANGLLAAAAFATENEGAKRPEMAAVMNGVARHLANKVFAITPLAGCQDARAMIGALSLGAESADLQRATTEALAFIGYVKRFARKEGDT
jgi:CRISPR/Cas system CMR-associated protein Cmr5 small subunit